jgi:hypothetical protein
VSCRAGAEAAKELGVELIWDGQPAWTPPNRMNWSS